MVIMAVGITALVSVFSMGIFSNQDAENTAIAINLATEKIEELKNKSFASIVNEPQTQVSDFPTFTRSVSVITTGTNPASSLKEVTVNVNWQTKSQNQTHSLTALFADF